MDRRAFLQSTFSAAALGAFGCGSEQRGAGAGHGAGAGWARTEASSAGESDVMELNGHLKGEEASQPRFEPPNTTRFGPAAAAGHDAGAPRPQAAGPRVQTPLATEELRRRAEEGRRERRRGRG